VGLFSCADREKESDPRLPGRGNRAPVNSPAGGMKV
jgi:hypothetical protein